MLMRQAVYLHFFSYSKHRFWAFTQMQRAHTGLQQCKGLQFYKMLGTGAGAGFSLRPDFSTYALLTVWDNEQRKEKAFDKAAVLQAFLIDLQNSGSIRYVPYTPTASGVVSRHLRYKNLWGINPLGSSRATLNPFRLIDFWHHVPQASRAIKQAKGVGFFKGIGEWPFVQQATFSIWESAEAIRTFAYESQAHASIVKKTRERKWYKEDMFNRFEIISETINPAT